MEELSFPAVKPLTRDLTLSHFKAEEEPPALKQWTIPEALKRTAKREAESELFIFRAPNKPRVVITGSQLLQTTEIVAAQLIEAGIESGDRIGLMSPNCPEYIFADYGGLRAGGGVLRMHSSFQSGEDLLYIINKTECKGIIVVPGQDNEYLNLLCSMLPNLSQMDAKKPLEFDNLPSLKFVMIISDTSQPGMRNLLLNPSDVDENLRQKQAEMVEEREKTIKPEDPCSFYLTSGSTGFPKVVALNHIHLVNGTLVISSFFGTTLKLMTDRPFSHIGGSTISAVVRGVSGVYLDPKTAVANGNTDFFFSIIEEEKVTCSGFFPYVMYDLLAILENKRYDLSCVKTGIVGGQCVPRHLLKQCLQKMPDFVNIYGMTEAGPFLLSTVSSDPEDLKLDYTGYPTQFSEFKILDKEGNIVPVNTVGMLYVRTPLMFVCYWDDEKKTSAARDKDGWYKTDDMAVMNERGYINILGRQTEVIMKASINIYPITIEKFLIDHPKIDKVTVVGVPDPKLFEEVCACIIPVSGSGLTVKAVEEYCDKHLLTKGSADGLGLRPRYFLIWEEFPMNMTQKIDKKAMKEIAAKELGLI